MSRSSFFFILLFIALFVMIFFIYKYYSKYNKDEPASSEHFVLVAKDKILVGAPLLAQNLKWQTWPEKGIDAGRYILKSNSTPEMYIGKIVTDAFFPGDPITPLSLSPTDNVFSTKISAGKRAFSFMINKDFPLLKYLRAGDEVDIMAAPQNRETEGKLLLEKVRILDVHDIFKKSLSKDGEADDDKQNKNLLERQVTVELVPQDIEKILADARRGSLILSLQSKNTQEATIKVPAAPHKITIIRPNKKESIHVGV